MGKIYPEIKFSKEKRLVVGGWAHDLFAGEEKLEGLAAVKVDSSVLGMHYRLSVNGDFTDDAPMYTRVDVKETLIEKGYVKPSVQAVGARLSSMYTDPYRYCTKGNCALVSKALKTLGIENNLGENMALSYIEELRDKLKTLQK